MDEEDCSEAVSFGGGIDLVRRASGAAENVLFENRARVHHFGEFAAISLFYVFFFFFFFFPW